MEKIYSITIRLYFDFRNPWDITSERNLILTVTLQACYAAPIILYFILIPQFLFFAITYYFNAFIEDVKMTIKKFDSKDCGDIKSVFVEMCNLHWNSLAYDFFINTKLKFFNFQSSKN